MDYNKYKKVFDMNDGIIKTSDFVNAGYHNTILKKLIKDGKITIIKRGYYEWQNEAIISDVVIIKKLFPDAIVCRNSALYIWIY